MQITHVSLMNELAWFLSSTDPEKLSLKCLPGWKLVNPLKYEFIAGGSRPKSGYHPPSTDGSSYYLLEKRLIFVVPKGTSVEEVFKGLSELGALLRNLRAITRNSLLPLQIEIAALSEPRTLKKLPITPTFSCGREKNVILNPMFYGHPMTWSALKEADERAAAGLTPEVFDEVMLDAQAAVRSSDWSKAILYSAIGMEILVSQVLNVAIELAYQSSPYPKHLNIRSTKVHATKTEVADPVYNFLRRKSDFKDLLDEVTSYVMKKSMLLADPNLYQRAVRLYKSRNSFAHEGKTENNGRATLLGVNELGAKEGFGTARDVCRWYGVKYSYDIPTPSRMIAAYSTQLVASPK